MVNNASGVKAEVMEARENAILGYVKMDALSSVDPNSNTPTLLTGQFNERPVYRGLVNSLVRDFNSRGLFPFLQKNCIQVGVYPTWINPACIRKTCDNLQTVVWTPEAKDQNTVLYNGQHRLHAIQDYLKENQNVQKKIEKSLESLAQTNSQAEVLKTQLADLQGLYQTNSYWGVELIDMCKS